MNKKDAENLMIYYEIHNRKRNGDNPTRIARNLRMDYRTVQKYLLMSEEEYIEFLEAQSIRGKKLDQFESYIKTRLEDCPEASAAQVFDWLKEDFDDLPDVNEKTVFNYTLFIRIKHGITKPFLQRDFTQVPELPYGKQAQVDFGERIMQTLQGGRKKVYIFSMVLSRSRFKFIFFSETPFTTETTIRAHELAFEFFGGVPQEIVYDQDTVLLISENYGDLLLTERFRQYVQSRGFHAHFCRKSDPQSKGKIENVIKYIKYNFLRGRIFVNIDTLNTQGIAWLARTANAKVHAATRLIPAEQWDIERAFLSSFYPIALPEDALKVYKVRKDNAVVYKSNFYGLPPGTYTGPDTVVYLKQNTSNELLIYNTAQTELVRYQVHPGRGKFINNNNFKRDYSESIDQLITELSAVFDNPEKVQTYFNQIRKANPRYTRDQLGLIRKMTKKYPMEIVNPAIEFCLEHSILRATDVESVILKVRVERNNPEQLEEPVKVRTMDESSFRIIPGKSSISDYQNLMS